MERAEKGEDEKANGYTEGFMASMLDSYEQPSPSEIDQSLMPNEKSATFHQSQCLYGACLTL